MVRIGHLGRVSPESVQEVMASRIVPIVLSSHDPKYIIEDGKTELIAHTEKDFARHAASDGVPGPARSDSGGLQGSGRNSFLGVRL